MNIRLIEARVHGARFLRWWLAELQSCGIDIIGLIMPRWRQVMTAHLGEGQLSLVDQAAEPIVILPWHHASGVLLEDAPESLATAMKRGNRVRIVVSAGEAFVRQLEMPLAASEHLSTAIKLQLPKLLPVSDSELLTDFEVKATHVDSRRIIIDLAAIKRADLDPIVTRLRGWGLRVVSVHLADSASAPRRFRFLHSSFTRWSYILRKSDKWLVGSAAALCFVCVTTAAVQSYRSQRALDGVRATTTARASTALSRRQQLLSRLAPLESLSESEKVPQVSALLAEITALVPQNTWLTTFELKERRLKLVGLSPNAAAVVKLLSSSPLLSDATLRSSMSAGIGTGLDRFEITTTLKVPAQ